MAKFKAEIDFRGFKEEKDFQKNEEFEMTVKRAEEIETTILKEHPEIKKVMTRIDDKEENGKEKSSKKE